jgi:hypothetical protein
VRVRLDREVASTSWTNWFPGPCVRHLVTSTSDHLPILLDMESESSPNQKGHILRYEIMWEREVSLIKEIHNSWEASHPVQSLGDVATNLKLLMLSLKRWSKQKFGAVTGELGKIRKPMEEVGDDDHGSGSDEMRDPRFHMDELLYHEEMIWL